MFCFDKSQKLTEKYKFSVVNTGVPATKGLHVIYRLVSVGDVRLQELSWNYRLFTVSVVQFTGIHPFDPQTCTARSFLPALNRIGSLRDKGGLSPGLEGHRQNGSLDTRGDLINSSVQGLQRVALYVLGEKNQMKVSGELINRLFMRVAVYVLGEKSQMKVSGDLIDSCV